MTRRRICSIPQRFAAASLKQITHVCFLVEWGSYSAAIRCGLIEACTLFPRLTGADLYSAAIRCGLIEAETCAVRWRSFLPTYSAAIRCGLIEAAPLA